MFAEVSKGTDAIEVGMAGEVHDRASWNVKWKLEKYADDEAYREGRTYEVLEWEDNILLNAGIALMIDLLMGAGGTVYNNANSYIAVGTSNTAEAASQTALTGEVRKAMDATFPSRASQTVTWKSTFASADANQVWAEAGVRNASTAGTLLNRKVQAMGTKASGTSWAITLSITIS